MLCAMESSESSKFRDIEIPDDCPISQFLQEQFAKADEAQGLISVDDQIAILWSGLVLLEQELNRVRRGE